MFHGFFAHINRCKNQVYGLSKHQHRFQTSIPRVPLNKRYLEGEREDDVPICPSTPRLHRVSGKVPRDHSTQRDAKRVKHHPISKPGTRQRTRLLSSHPNRRTQYALDNTRNNSKRVNGGHTWGSRSNKGRGDTAGEVGHSRTGRWRPRGNTSI